MTWRNEGSAGPIERLQFLLPKFAARAARHDADDTFVSENYAGLKKHRLMALAVPTELGGDGLELRDLATLLRGVAPACASTALAYSMHIQAVCSLAWHWRHHHAPVTSILRGIARDQLAIATTNGSDWLEGSGTAIRTKSGFRIDAAKRIVSAGCSSDLLATNAIYNDPIAGPTVLHFIVRMSDRHVSIEPTWQAMGMRGSGSNNVCIAGLTISDRSIVARRPAGQWHPLYYVAVMIALPLIFSVYLGIAESARDIAIQAAKQRPMTDLLVMQAGVLEGHLKTARMAVNDMLSAYTDQPDLHSANHILMARTLAGEARAGSGNLHRTISGVSA